MGQRADDIERREVSEMDQHDVEFDEATATAREDIELTRSEMTSTIDAIQDRLDPEVLSDQAKDTAHDVTDYAIREAKQAAREITDHAIEQARGAVHDITGQARTALREATVGKVETMVRTATDTAGGWRQSVFETIKANPMPAALVGLGVGWMLLNRPSSGPIATRSNTGYGVGPYAAGGYNASAYRADSGSETGGVTVAANAAQQTLGRAADRAQHTAGEAVQQVQGTAGEVMDQLQESGGQVVDQIQDTGAQMMGQVQEQASRAQGFLERQLEENPLLVGAVAVAIGGVLAGTVCSTPREDQLLGSARDRLMGSAKELTQDTMQKVGKVVDEAQSAATEAAREQSLMPAPSGTSSGS